MKAVFLQFLKLYRLLLAPFVPTTCRFYPTCSDYMAQSIERKGLARGVLCGLRRLLKCHPFHPGGYDPVR